ncbi:hypothetical protein FRC03_004238 [Tulasnella sp. 419]|nr:hypothetical protein FRC02_005509 [Tulasnella sp. 418]KAG8962431.1 hypothetical protein FRC03_004238 [Tulasnella sp. 419]
MTGMLSTSKKAQFYTLFVILCITPSSWAARIGPEPDPFIDPKNDPWNPLRYIASNTLTAIAFALYMLTAGILFFNTWKWGAKYMLCMPIGAVTMSLGLALRFGLAKDPHSRGIYITEYLFVVLSPCAFIAAVYILLGRLVGHLGMDHYLLVRSNRVTAIFITSDVITFLIQAAGGGISASIDIHKRETGEKIFLSGLILQLISFVFFCILFLVFMYRFHHNRQDIWNYQKNQGVPWHSDWRTLAVALVISCIGILIRSFYRVIELAQGWQGHLATTEGFFYGLDTYPLLVAISVYIPFWPGRFINPSNRPLESETDAKRVSDDNMEKGATSTQPVEMSVVLTHSDADQDRLSSDNSRTLTDIQRPTASSG